MLAAELNIDPVKLLGHNGTGEMVPVQNMTIEAEAVEAEAIATGDTQNRATAPTEPAS
jgi:hypothetical protein